MGLIFAFVIFIGFMVAMLITGHSMIWALLVGLVLFFVLGLWTLTRGEGDPLIRSTGDAREIRDARGTGAHHLSLKEAFRALTVSSWHSVKESLIVIEVMLIIGFITAAWRISGTITVFVYYGMKIIIPQTFLIITFLLACLLSYALGTSFGVAGTVGVIFMALARSGGVNPIITAGVLMSGIYFGDRGSPVSSSANMVAGITKTDILENVRIMMKTAILPFAISLAIYVVLSLMNPIQHVDPQIISAFEDEFTLSPWAFLPAAIMLILPLCKVGVILSISISVVCSVAIAWLVEKIAFLEILKVLIFGYHSQGEGLSAILDGGGLVSMLEIAAILAISCAYSGIFVRTDMLKNLLNIIERSCIRLGRYETTIIISLATCFVFCNQTIATLMCNDLLRKPYLNTGGTNQELAIDMENTVIVVVGLIPWCIACSVPLTFFGVGFEALPWAFYMYLIPICYFFTKRMWFKNRAVQGK